MPLVDAMTVGDRKRLALEWPVLGATLAAIIAIHWQTFASLVSVWRQSDTFAHCFLIAPISLYLIWRQRAALENAPKRVSMLGLAAVLVLSAGWLVATAANVQVGRQLTAVLLLPAAVLAVLGTEATKKIAFPLGFLLFAVPFGEALIPTLMGVTATFTVAALKLTGIPVLREGMFFSIPSGDFAIAKACSGIRYLIACSALGFLYSYLSYRSWRKRALFIAVSLVAPVIANGLRAYMIVMIAHLSEMKLAVGVDHLIYGWLFFGGLVALLFWVGGRFQDPPLAAAATAARRGGTAGLALVGAALSAVGLAAVGPYLAYSGETRAAVPSVAAGVPELAGAWRGPVSPGESWRKPSAAAHELRARYLGAAGEVDLEALVYGAQRQDAEMVGALPAMIDPHRWQTGEDGVADPLPSGFAPRELVLRSAGVQRLLWYWYLVGETRVTEDWRAKVVEAWTVLVHGPARSSLIIVSTEAADLPRGRALLREFVQEAQPRIEACVHTPADDCSDAQ